jgi:hypothetical protein
MLRLPIKPALRGNLYNLSGRRIGALTGGLKIEDDVTAGPKRDRARSPGARSERDWLQLGG